MDYNRGSLKMHEKNKGKISVEGKIQIKNKDDLSMAYSPGVAEPCKEIFKNKKEVYRYTSKGNLIAVVSDGSAVLGLGDIGAEASIPVMEGKSLLFKEFGNVDAVPICLNTKDVDEIVKTIKIIEPTFGGINLEDISAPRCFEIEDRLIKELNIPVFHDDQHGTAIVTAAGLINSLKIVNKNFKDIKVVINGSGAAGIAIAKMLINLGVENILLCDSEGIVYPGNPRNNWVKDEIAKLTNPQCKTGYLKEAIKGSDVFIGVSIGNVLDDKMVLSMNNDPIIFAMANPVPEINPEDAKRLGVRIIGTGRSDYPNQVNNILAFPGLFRGVLDSGVKNITDEIKLTAAHAIANSVKDLDENNILPNPLDKKVSDNVAKAIIKLVEEKNI